MAEGAPWGVESLGRALASARDYEEFAKANPFNAFIAKPPSGFAHPRGDAKLAALVKHRERGDVYFYYNNNIAQ